MMKPIHPGEVLYEDFIRRENTTVETIAQHTRLTVYEILLIIGGKKDITDFIATELAQFFYNNAEFWLRLQKSYNYGIADYKLTSKENYYAYPYPL